METNLPILKMENISKNFDAVQALNQISLEVNKGDIVGLVGDNGAGKSTLVKIISGMYQEDNGTIYFEGKPVNIKNPSYARSLGIETVYQELALVNQLTVSANIFLGREKTKWGLVGKLCGILDNKKMNSETGKVVDSIKINIPEIEKKVVKRMSGGQRQTSAISRAVYWGSKILLLDEPTAALGVAQTAEVLRIIKNTAEQGIPLIVISHNLEDVFSVCNRIIVLRLGKKVFDGKADSTTPQEVVEYMTGAKSAKAV